MGRLLSLLSFTIFNILLCIYHLRLSVSCHHPSLLSHLTPSCQQIKLAVISCSGVCRPADCGWWYWGNRWDWFSTWWCHDMEMLSSLLALCEGNPPVTGGFPPQRASNAGLWFSIILSLNKLLNKLIWTSLSSVQERQLNLITDSLTVEQTVELLVIWEAILLMLCLYSNWWYWFSGWNNSSCYLLDGDEILISV